MRWQRPRGSGVQAQQGAPGRHNERAHARDIGCFRGGGLESTGSRARS
jgi:hypothetical protein